VDTAFKPEPPPAELAPGAPDDEEMQAACEAWSQSSDHATELRTALQAATQADDDGEVTRLKQEVGALLAEHRTLTEEYKRLKAERPDWKARLSERAKSGSGQVFCRAAAPSSGSHT
jgi:hypothetical protein